MTVISRPAIVDDSGDGLTGTEVNAAWMTLLEDEIDDQCHSTTNPTVKPKAVTDEVVAARGSKASLDARLDIAHNDDGTHKADSSWVTAAAAQALGWRNMFHDSRLILWPDGDAAAPAGWVLNSGTVARCGTGLGDTTKLQFGKWCMKVTNGGATAKLTKALILAADYDDGFDSKVVTIAVRCKTDKANAASLVIDDGATTTRGGETGNSTYHSGDNAEHWIYATHTISALATKLDVYVEMAVAGDAYFGAFMFVVGSIVPSVWVPERWGKLLMGFQVRGNLVVGDGQNDWQARLPIDAYCIGLAGSVETAPTGAAITFDIDKTTDLAAWNAIYSTLPDIDATEKEIDDGARTVPDGTYAYRCFKEGDFFRVNINLVGSVIAGAELSADVGFIAPLPELELLRY